MYSKDEIRGIMYGLEYDKDDRKKAEAMMDCIVKAAKSGEDAVDVDLEQLNACHTLQPMEILAGYGFNYEWIGETVIRIYW